MRPTRTCVAERACCRRHPARDADPRHIGRPPKNGAMGMESRCSMSVNIRPAWYVIYYSFAGLLLPSPLDITAMPAPSSGCRNSVTQHLSLPADLIVASLSIPRIHAAPAMEICGVFPHRCAIFGRRRALSSKWPIIASLDDDCVVLRTSSEAATRYSYTISPRSDIKDDAMDIS